MRPRLVTSPENLRKAKPEDRFSRSRTVRDKLTIWLRFRD